MIKKNNSGFTFIELIIATAILLSLVGFGTASYVNFNERQVLEQAAKNLKNTLRLAQQNAISGVKEANPCIPTNLNAPSHPEMGKEQTFRGWCMSPVDDNTYQIYGVCDSNEDDTQKPLTFPSSISGFDLPNGITLDSQSSSLVSGIAQFSGVPNETNSRVRFNVFGNNVQLADDTTYIKVTYCLTGSFGSLGLNKKYAVTVRKSGEIIDEGFTSNCFSNPS